MGLNSRPQAISPEAKTVITPPRTLILSGVQGSGKGTQGSRLIKDFNYNQFEMGAVLRAQAGRVVNVPQLKSVPLNKIITGCPSLLAPAAAVLGCTPADLQQKLAEKPDATVSLSNVEMTIGEIQGLGALVPQDVVMAIADEFMTKSGTEGNLMFDGMPRTIDQNAALEERLAGAGRLDDAHMLLIDISDEVARANIGFRAVLDGRKDDADPATVERRISTFHNATRPIADHYNKKGKLLVVNGETGIDMTEPTRIEARLREVKGRLNSAQTEFFVPQIREALQDCDVDTVIAMATVLNANYQMPMNDQDLRELVVILDGQLRFTQLIKKSIDEVYQRVLASFPKN